ncbi:Os11g0480300 [Oryza sativa Japonica Group]|uniref:Os11g0480300 protein n=1 Tax=Oryza sativa subsp. japonica TaxID=39947 RepID=A0A0P0Y294_ORYSJ|nr:Os11g0480300 [Oryza sativa Japonica Group]
MTGRGETRPTTTMGYIGGDATAVVAHASRGGGGNAVEAVSKACHSAVAPYLPLSPSSRPTATPSHPRHRWQQLILSTHAWIGGRAHE